MRSENLSKKCCLRNGLKESVAPLKREVNAVCNDMYGAQTEQCSGTYNLNFSAVTEIDKVSRLKLTIIK
jgi:hypothetical protein